MYSRVFMTPTLLLLSICKRRRCEVPYNCLDDVPHFMKRRAADDVAQAHCVCRVSCAVLVSPPFVSSCSLQEPSRSEKRRRLRGKQVPSLAQYHALFLLMV